jgi:hypothetical protein
VPPYAPVGGRPLPRCCHLRAVGHACAASEKPHCHSNREHHDAMLLPLPGAWFRQGLPNWWEPVRTGSGSGRFRLRPVPNRSKFKIWI